MMFWLQSLSVFHQTQAQHQPCSTSQPSLKDTRLCSPGHTGLPFSHTGKAAARRQIHADHFPPRRTEGILTASTRAREPIQLRKRELLPLPLLCDMARKGPEPSPLPAVHWVTQTIPANRKCRIRTVESCTENVQRSSWRSRNLKNLCYPSAFKQGKLPFFSKPKLKAKMWMVPQFTIVTKAINPKAKTQSRLEMWATKCKIITKVRGTMDILFQLISQKSEKQLTVNVMDTAFLQSTFKSLRMTLMRKEWMKTLSDYILGISRRKICCLLPPESLCRFLEILHNKCAGMCSTTYHWVMGSKSNPSQKYGIVKVKRSLLRSSQSSTQQHHHIHH